MFIIESHIMRLRLKICAKSLKKKAQKYVLVIFKQNFNSGTAYVLRHKSLFPTSHSTVNKFLRSVIQPLRVLMIYSDF